MSSRSIGVTNSSLRRRMMSWVIRSPSCSQIRMSLASVALAAAVALVIGLLLATVEDLRDSQQRAGASERVLVQSGVNERLVIDMETGLRGFLVTREDSLLAPWQSAVQAYPAAARKLETLTADDATQQRRARAVDAAVRSYANGYVAPLIRLARSNPAGARTPAVTMQGKRLVDAIRARFTQLDAADATRASARRRHADAVADRALAEAIAGFVALLALISLMARYLRRVLAREERAAGRERLAQARMEVLARASEVLAESLDYEQTLERVAHIAVPAVADWCTVDLAGDDGSLRNVAVAHVDPDKVALARELQARYPPDPDSTTGAVNVIRTGNAELYPEIPDELLETAARDAEERRILRELGLVSGMVVPLIAHGRTLGAITFISAESGRRYGDDDLAFARDVARRAAVAIDNARLYERERGVAETLQRSLLPHTLPVVPRAVLAARYLPAQVGAEVGGDWYDVIPLPDGRFALVIGDVVGSGVRAAATMGQLRSALRAYALDGRTPSAALDRLKQMLRVSTGAGMIGTVLVAIFDPATGQLRYASAGHPPPLVRNPDGSTAFLGEGRGTPLAVGFQSAREAVEQLEPGSLVMLYTDGLVERRSERLGDGLRRLERAVATGPEGAEELLDHVLAQLTGGGSVADDVALLALAPVREGAARMRIELPADRSSVTSARQTVARWLAGAGATESERYELTVALGDACANAVEHAYGPDDATFEIGAELIDGEVVIDVRDTGNWREPRGVNRGRGLQLMNAFTDSLEIDTSGTGTRVRMRRRLSMRPSV